MNDNMICSEEERLQRLETCKQCSFFTVRDDYTTDCASNGCKINLMITYKFKICPIGNWS